MQQQASLEECLRGSEARSLERSRARIDREAADMAVLLAIQVQQHTEPEIHGVIPGGPNPWG